MRLHVGCAMWNLKSWHGRLFGPGLRSYAEWCNAVEGNTTFYATPSRSTVETWAQQTDPDFRFVLKLPKLITHVHRLAGYEADLSAFLDAIEPLGPRVHALWIQLPGSFAPVDVSALTGFLQELPTTFRYAVEVRHRAFFDDPRSARLLERALAPTGSEWIPFDTVEFFRTAPTSDAEREAWTKKPRMPRRDTALTDHPIVRYLGRDDPHETVAGWRHWATVTAGWLREGRSPTVFIHTPDNADAPSLARQFHDEVRAEVPDLDPLPETHPLTLF